MMRITLAVLTFAGLACASAVPAFAADWTVDAAHSKLGFSLPWGNEPYAASFRKWTAEIGFDPADLAHAHVTASIDTASLDSGDSDTDESITGEKGFDSGHFAAAKFEARSFRHVAADKYEADGTLTVRGTARPVHLAFNLTIAGARAHMAGAAQVRWADFGMGRDMGAELPNLGAVVTIHVDLAAAKR